MPNFPLSGSQGSTFSLLFRATNCTGAPINLSGYNLRSSIREKFSSTTGIASFTSTVVTAASGICSIAVTSSGMAAIPAGIYLYDVEAADALETDTIKLLNGYFFIQPQISY